MDNPFSGEFGGWVGGIASGAAAAYFGFRKWSRKDRAEERRDGAERRVDDIYAVVIKTMQAQILALTNDGIHIRAALAICEKQHKDCREETDSQRLQIDGMRGRIEELEKRLYE